MRGWYRCGGGVAEMWRRGGAREGKEQVDAENERLEHQSRVV